MSDPERRPDHAADATPVTAGDDRIAAVRTYWETHVTDWPATRAEPGTERFFREAEAYRFEKLDYLERIIDYDGEAGRTVLDVGCGLANDTGRFAAGGAGVIGIDIAPRAIALSRTNFEQRGLSGRFLLMNGEAMTLEANSVDFVYCHTVLHFTAHPERMVAEIHRVLKPGGRAVLMMVNRHSWLRFLHRLMKVEIDHLQSPEFHWYSPGEFRGMLEPFAEVDLVLERFPVRTKVHGGLKARLFNLVFVDLFNLLPRALVRRCGHHMIAFVRK
ncbi:class I SAM-dependent methyltransferase [Oceanibacterium hippocampi]|uniref:Ubiquinone biosynthesis O-methyltransferase n=1 Tax=Oceanibacterium hippocampi TaxID=745714 RepID=A0A1Y5T4K5_9PROT|nr:class I SAM-dependent methyltransferase [Oceanibacterium hippocampi]SLN55679.1 Ubiquinone biosynthesis O-methyltransferase [Oceanibacterium hippocampi]